MQARSSNATWPRYRGAQFIELVSRKLQKIRPQDGVATSPSTRPRTSRKGPCAFLTKG